MNKSEIDSFIKGFLSENGITYEQINEKQHIHTRKELVLEIRDKSNLSIRQIAGILGVDRGVVERIIK